MSMRVCAYIYREGESDRVSVYKYKWLYTPENPNNITKIRNYAIR